MSYEWLDRSISMPGPHLTLVTTEEDFDDAMAHCEVKHAGPWLGLGAGATCHFLTHETDGGCVVVAIAPNPEKTGIEIACLLVHEAVHVVQHYFEHIVERTPASEQQAYAIQIVSSVLMEEYVRQVIGKD